MAKIKRTWDLISKEKRRESITSIIDFFKNERNEEIGVIAAENILDHFLQNIGTDIYNQAIENSINLLKERFEDVALDIESLKKSV